MSVFGSCIIIYDNAIFGLRKKKQFGADYETQTVNAHTQCEQEESRRSRLANKKVKREQDG